MLKPDENDPLKIRRWLFLIGAFNGLFFVPEIFNPIMSIIFHRSDAWCANTLDYTRLLCLGSVLPYVVGLHKQGSE